MANFNNSQIAIIDYGMGNLFNVQRACASVGLESVITADKDIIFQSKAMILPGVGAFGDAIYNLRKLDLVGVIKDYIGLNKPFLGICLGMQLLLTESEEFGGHKGLDIIKGRVVRFKNQNEKGQKIKVPQVGWNQINFKKESDFLDGVINSEYMYFVHSYYACLDDESDALTTTCYEGTEYCSSLLKGSILATQFHPERSGLAGLKIYKSWAKNINRNKEIVKE